MQECSFLVEAAPCVFEGLAGGTTLALTSATIYQSQKIELRLCGFLYFRIDVFTIEKSSYLVRHLATAQRARSLDARV